MKRLFCTLGFLMLTSACTPVGSIMTIGSHAGTMAMEERGFQGATADLGLKADIVRKWAASEISFASDLSVIVYDGRAMVMGSVDTEEQRAEAISIVWQVEGVKEVLNEILLKQGGGFENFTHDAWINTKLSAALTFDGDVLDINYKFDTENGVVYLIGLAQSHGELKRVIARAKSMEYVRKVVSHVKVKPRKSMYRKNYNQKD